MNEQTTVVLGASPHADRYAYLAVQRLVAKGFPVIAVGKRPGTIGEVPIVADLQGAHAIHTVTLYLNPGNQRQWYSRILAWKPHRIIFNPGTENDELAQQASKAGIEVVTGCTLVMLAAGTY